MFRLQRFLIFILGLDTEKPYQEIKTVQKPQEEQ